MTLNYEALYIAARKYISKCPCDPDITSAQLQAWNELQELEKRYAIHDGENSWPVIDDAALKADVARARHCIKAGMYLPDELTNALITHALKGQGK